MNGKKNEHKALFLQCADFFDTLIDFLFDKFLYNPSTNCLRGPHTVFGGCTRIP